MFFSWSHFVLAATASTCVMTPLVIFGVVENLRVIFRFMNFYERVEAIFFFKLVLEELVANIEFLILPVKICLKVKNLKGNGYGNITTGDLSMTSALEYH